MAVVGNENVNLNGTLIGFTATRQGSVSDSTTGFGDLYPQATLRWNNGVRQFHDLSDRRYPGRQLQREPARQSWHRARRGRWRCRDYTFQSQHWARRFSFVTGVTYNLGLTRAPIIKNGIDWHLDWGASGEFLSKQFLVGAVGYFYAQPSPDRGPALILGPSQIASYWHRAADGLRYAFRSGRRRPYLDTKSLRRI